MTIDMEQQLEARYAWKPIKDNVGSRSWKRSTINCEHLFEIFRETTGDSVSIHNLIFVELDEPISRKDLLIRLLNAWMNVKAETPIVAAKINKTGDNTAPELVVDEMDAEAEQEWALQTVVLEECNDEVITLDSMPQTMTTPAIPSEEGYNALIRCTVPHNQTTFTSIVLNVWMNHSLFDGVSARIILSDLRKYLARPAMVVAEPLPARLPGLTTSLMDSKWGSPSSTMSEVHLNKMQQAVNSLVHQPAPRDATLQSFTSVTHAWEKFSREETKEITRYCKKYHMTATPFILSSLLVRRILDCAHQWPIAKEAVYTQIIPIDPRSILTKKRAVGMCSVYDFLIVPIGEIFNGRSKDEMERDSVEMIHQVSLKANETFSHDRSEETRAELLRYNEANLAPVLSATATGDANPSTNIMNLYPDCLIGEPSLEMEITPSLEGIGSTVKDVYMHVKAELDTTLARTWVFKGQTVITINASYGFMKEEEANIVVKAWKKDILSVCRESEWSEEAMEEGYLGCNPSVPRI